MYRKYQQREDAIKEEMTKINLGVKRGIKQGIVIGEKRGEKKRAEAMAIEMLADKVDIKFIFKYTKLSVEEIKALEKN